jgi:hypothetical protein
LRSQKEYVTTEFAEVQVEAQADPQWLLGNTKHELNNLWRRCHEYEMPIPGVENTDALVIVHIRRLEEENMRLRSASFPRHDTVMHKIAVLHKIAGMRTI